MSSDLLKLNTDSGGSIAAAKYVCPNRITAKGFQGLCILLRRPAYPCQLLDIIPRFGRPKSELCLITT